MNLTTVDFPLNNKDTEGCYFVSAAYPLFTVLTINPKWLETQCGMEEVHII
jgi:hypothetical protein